MPSNAKSMKFSKADAIRELTLLLVETDPKALSEYGELLGRRFSCVYTARNGAEGVDAFNREQPDIVLADVDLEGTDGIAMALLIKKASPETPVIVMCSFADASVLGRAINAGVDAYLQKPLNRTALCSTIDKITTRLVERRRYARETKLLQEYRKAVDSSAIVSKTDRDGIITYANQAFCDISGYTEEELVGAKHSIVRSPNTPDAFYADMWGMITHKRIWRGNFENRKKDGSSYYVSATIVPIVDENDAIVEFIAIRQDITALQEHRFNLEQRVREEVEKNIAEREEREIERLREAKFSAIGRLAAGITHEINTPLTYMRGNLEMLIEDIARLEESPLRGYLLEDAKTVAEGVDRIANIVESMREMASQTKETMAVRNLYATLVVALTMAYNRSKQICAITLQGDPFVIGMPKGKRRYEVCMQRQRIEQVWIIIINNALDELKKAGPYETRSLVITIEDHEAEVTVRFKDSGGGIDPKILPKIFEPFQSTKTEGGIGIGLNVAKKIVEMHHGTIEAYNEGDGAVFVVTLPKKCRDSD